MKHSSIIFIIVCLALVAMISGCNEEKTTLAEKRLVDGLIRANSPS